MKPLPVLAAIIGLTLIASLIVYFGPDAVLRSLVAFGWGGFAAICLIHIALIGAMGLAWGALLPGTRHWIPIWGRLVRDSGSELLPLSQVGGYVLGARALTLTG
ncbi:MAG TPA: TIGR00374 family protein, partial [Stellaceae bacterium]|nr:TIGR00374 family protein [Stellaceae bacterium]